MDIKIERSIYRSLSFTNPAEDHPIWIDEIKLVFACCGFLPSFWTWVGMMASLEVLEFGESESHVERIPCPVSFVVDGGVDYLSDAYVEEMIYVVASF